MELDSTVCGTGSSKLLRLAKRSWTQLFLGLEAPHWCGLWTAFCLRHGQSADPQTKAAIFSVCVFVGCWDEVQLGGTDMGLQPLTPPH